MLQDAATSVDPTDFDAVKRQYFKAIRALHPDKVVSAAEDVRLEYARVFAVLTESYKRAQSVQQQAQGGSGGGAASAAPAKSSSVKPTRRPSFHSTSAGYAGARR